MIISELRKRIAFLKKLDKKDALLGLYEAITKLQIATLQKDTKEIAKKLSNVLIGAAVAADTFNIKNLDKSLDDRINELHKLLK